jgi:uncharacterized membrane protein
MHDLLRRLVTEPDPGGCHRDDGGALRLVVPQDRVDDYLQLAVEEIWHYGRDSPRIPGRVKGMLDDLQAVARPEHRRVVEAWQGRIRERDPDW